MCFMSQIWNLTVFLALIPTKLWSNSFTEFNMIFIKHFNSVRSLYSINYFQYSIHFADSRKKIVCKFCDYAKVLKSVRKTWRCSEIRNSTQLIESSHEILYIAGLEMYQRWKIHKIKYVVFVNSLNSAKVEWCPTLLQ